MGVFRDCNTKIDFSHGFVTSSIAKIPRYHQLHYVPRVFTWDWTALQRLTGYERLQRFLFKNPIPVGQHAIGLYLYCAKTEKVDLGLLMWPQGYWEARYEKSKGGHQAVGKMMKQQLKKLIFDEKLHVIEEARQQKLEREERILESLSRRYTGNYYDSAFNQGPLYFSSSQSMSKQTQIRMVPPSPPLPSALAVILNQQLVDMSCSSKVQHGTPTSSIVVSGRGAPISEEGTLSSEPDELNDQLEEEYQREWAETVGANQENEGLGWWTAMGEGQEPWPNVNYSRNRFPNDMESPKPLDAEVNTQEWKTEPDIFDNFNFLGLGNGDANRGNGYTTPKENSSSESLGLLIPGRQEVYDVEGQGAGLQHSDSSRSPFAKFRSNKQKPSRCG